MRFAHTVGGLRGSSKAQCLAHAQRLANSPVPIFAIVLKGDGESGLRQRPRAVYHRLGFSDAYGYHYRTTDPGAS